jgi:hypothetical protein
VVSKKATVNGWITNVDNAGERAKKRLFAGNTNARSCEFPQAQMIRPQVFALHPHAVLGAQCRRNGMLSTALKRDCELPEVAFYPQRGAEWLT